MALNAQYLWRSRYYCSRDVRFLLCGSHRRCLCVCVFVCTRYVCVACVLSRKLLNRSSTTAAVQLREPCFKLSPLGQHESRTVYKYLCVVGAQQEIEPRQQQFYVQRNTQNTHGRTSYQVHQACSSSESSSLSLSGFLMFFRAR